ncbi:MAG: FecR family protein [Bacteroidales bacterium]
MKENMQHTPNRFIKDKEFILAYYCGDIEHYKIQIIEYSPESIEEFEQALELIKGISIKKRGYKQNEIIEQYINLERSIRDKNSSQRRKHFIFIASGVAAMVAILYTITFLVNPQISSEQMNMLLSYDDVSINSDYTQLFQEERLISTSKSEETIIEEKTLDSTLDNSDETSQLKLVVPYGKRAKLTLDDGSKLWVNAGSIVSYPSKFTGKKREILLDGEVYIEVAKDENRPFIIKSRDLDVKVLGTQFNFSSYSSLDEKSVTLISGKVEIKNQSSNKVILKPNEHLAINENNQTVTTVDVMDYTTWKDGYLSIRGLKVASILDKIAHYYNIKIVSQETLDYKCSGRLKLSTNPQDVLHMISQTAPVRFEKEGDMYYAYSTNK